MKYYRVCICNLYTGDTLGCGSYGENLEELIEEEGNYLKKRWDFEEFEELGLLVQPYNKYNYKERRWEKPENTERFYMVRFYDVFIKWEIKRYKEIIRKGLSWE